MKKIFLIIALFTFSGCMQETPVSNQVNDNEIQQGVIIENSNLSIVTETTEKPEAEKIEKEKTETAADVYAFEYNGILINMNDPADPLVEALGEPFGKFEAPSCAFDGIDRIYYYSGFELYTYPLDGVDHVSAVVFTDDSVQTEKGIYLGMDLDEVVEAYGDEYAEEMGMYTYTKGKTSVSFLIEDGEVAAVSYNYENL